MDIGRGIDRQLGKRVVRCLMCVETERMKRMVKNRNESDSVSLELKSLRSGIQLKTPLCDA